MGDLTRGVNGNSRVFAQFNAGKRSIAVDLKQAEGQELVKQLVAQADVLIENFRHGIMARFGLDYASLHKANPGLVYCSISGFGQTGPYRDRAAYAPIIHAASGFDAVFGGTQGNADARPPNWEIMMADIMTGAMAFGAVQTALLGKVKTGVGQYLDVSMMEAVMSLIPAHIQAAQMDDPDPIGRYCPVQTADGFMMVCVVSDKNMQCLADALDRQDFLTDERFLGRARRSNIDALAREIEKWSRKYSSKKCEMALNKASVPCAMYQKPEDLFDHPQVVERGSFAPIRDAQLGEFLIQNLPIQFTGFDATASDWVARLGEHTDSVLSTDLGISPEALADLRARAVIA